MGVGNKLIRELRRTTPLLGGMYGAVGGTGPTGIAPTGPTGQTGGTGPRGASTFQTLLGGLWVDEWDRERLASAAAWTSLGGRVVSATGPTGPTYSADGSNFGGGSVVKTTLDGDYMLGVGLSPLAVAGSRPYIAAVLRLAQNVGIQVLFSVAGAIGAEQYMVYLQTPNWVLRQTGVVTVTHPVAADTDTHLFEVWFDGANLNFAIDGVLATEVSASSMTLDVTKFAVGCDIALGSLPGDVCHGRYVFASAVPSAGVRAAILAAVQAADGV